MTDTLRSNGEGPGGEALGVTLQVVAQYIKDLSFENPAAPGSLFGNDTPPQIEASVDVAARRLGEVDFEAELRITAKARRGEATAFIVELVYAGLFRIANAPAEALQPLLLIECPRLLFPFARRLISDTTRDGGFAPLLLDPIDFATLYRRQLESQGLQPGISPAANA